MGKTDFVFGHVQIGETVSTPELAEKHKKEAAQRRRLYAIQEAARAKRGLTV